VHSEDLSRPAAFARARLGPRRAPLERTHVAGVAARRVAYYLSRPRRDHQACLTTATAAAGEGVAGGTHIPELPSETGLTSGAGWAPGLPPALRCLYHSAPCTR